MNPNVAHPGQSPAGTPLLNIHRPALAAQPSPVLSPLGLLPAFFQEIAYAGRPTGKEKEKTDDNQQGQESNGICASSIHGNLLQKRRKSRPSVIFVLSKNGKKTTTTDRRGYKENKAPDRGDMYRAARLSLSLSLLHTGRSINCAAVKTPVPYQKAVSICMQHAPPAAAAAAAAADVRRRKTFLFVVVEEQPPPLNATYAHPGRHL